MSAQDGTHANYHCTQDLKDHHIIAKSKKLKINFSCQHNFMWDNKSGVESMLADFPQENLIKK